MDTIQREQRYTSGCYPKREIAIVRGEGARLWDDTGREYIDCVSGHGVAIATPPWSRRSATRPAP